MSKPEENKTDNVKSSNKTFEVTPGQVVTGGGFVVAAGGFWVHFSMVEPGPLLPPASTGTIVVRLD